MMVKWLYRIAVFFLVLLIAIPAFGLAYLKWDQKNYVVPILMYHRVTDTAKKGSLITHPKLFEKHMAYIKKNNYKVISLDELVNGIKSGKTFEKDAVVITFDDGFEDNYTQAFKILNKYQYPATFFIPSGEIGGENMLKKEQIEDMIKNNYEIGGHALTRHSYLPLLEKDELYAEIRDTKEEIEKKFNITLEHFAYPVGGFSDEIKAIVKEVGYISASTTNRGYDYHNKDEFELNRVRLSDKDDRDYELWIKLTGYYNLWRKPKSPN